MSADPSLRPVKHSVTLRGHRTSVSLEAAFWDALGAMARRRGVSVNTLIAEVDASRDDPTVPLSSRLRVAILEAARRGDV